MKNLSIVLLVALFFIYSCDEVGPVINLQGPGGSDTTVAVDSNQQKMVLLEDFTATNCPNCPKGRGIVDDLLAAHPGRIEVVEVHQGPLSVPLVDGDPILKTDDGESLASYLGPPPFWPCGAIDRKLFPFSPDLILIDRNSWVTAVEEQLDSALKILIGMKVNYDAATKTLSGTVTIDYLQTITDALNITVLIKESGIVAGQLDGLTLIPDDVHDDVLRDIITNYTGDFVGGNKSAGSSWNFHIPTYTISTDWNADNCEIVVFISKSVNTYNVMQAMSLPLVQ